MPSCYSDGGKHREKLRALAHAKILALGILEGSNKYYQLLARWS